MHTEAMHGAKFNERHRPICFRLSLASIECPFSTVLLLEESDVARLRLVYLTRERSMNQSMTTTTTLHTDNINDAICSDYNIKDSVLRDTNYKFHYLQN